METRVAALAGLSGQGYDGTLLQPLRKTVLFRRPDGTPFGLWQYEAAEKLSGIADPDTAHPADRCRCPAIRRCGEGGAPRRPGPLGSTARSR